MQLGGSREGGRRREQERTNIIVCIIVQSTRESKVCQLDHLWGDYKHIPRCNVPMDIVLTLQVDHGRGELVNIIQ